MLNNFKIIDSSLISMNALDCARISNQYHNKRDYNSMNGNNKTPRDVTRLNSQTIINTIA